MLSKIHQGKSVRNIDLHTLPHTFRRQLVGLVGTHQCTRKVILLGNQLAPELDSVLAASVLAASAVAALAALAVVLAEAMERNMIQI